jgi:hypothetical protein
MVILLILSNSASAWVYRHETELQFKAGEPGSFYYVHFIQTAPFFDANANFPEEKRMISPRRISLSIGKSYWTFPSFDIRRLTWLILLVPALFIYNVARRSWLRRRAKAAD